MYISKVMFMVNILGDSSSNPDIVYLPKLTGDKPCLHWPKENLKFLFCIKGTVVDCSPRNIWRMADFRPSDCLRSL